jgi:hypothetical protein
MQNKRYYFTFLVEPADNLYRQLLDLTVPICKCALLVIHPNLPLEKTGKAALEQLSPFLISKEESHEWPGTILTNSTALILKYHLEPGCITILKRLADRLYKWEQPTLPEDLCFLREDSSAWLVSTSHEADSYLILTDQEYFQLLDLWPVLVNLVNRDEKTESQ